MGKAYSIGLACFAAIGYVQVIWRCTLKLEGTYWLFFIYSSFLFGYDSGVMTDVISSKSFQNYFDTTSTSSIIGAINSTFSGGAVFGALFGGVIMDKYGRRKTIGIGAAICTVGSILQAAAYQYVWVVKHNYFEVTNWVVVWLWCLLVELLLVSLLACSLWVVSQSSDSRVSSTYPWCIVPVYQSECASPKNRGLIVGLAQQMIGVGFIVSTWVGYGSHHMPDTSSFQWRFPLAFQTFPSALLCLGMLWLPETPRHLIATDRLDDGMRTLRKLHFDGSNDGWIKSEFNEIKLTLDAEKAATAPGWMIMFKVPQWRKRLMLGTLVQVFTQFTGIVPSCWETSTSRARTDINPRNQCHWVRF